MHQATQLICVFLSEKTLEKQVYSLAHTVVLGTSGVEA